MTSGGGGVGEKSVRHSRKISDKKNLHFKEQIKHACVLKAQTKTTTPTLDSVKLLEKQEPYTVSAFIQAVLSRKPLLKHFPRLYNLLSCKFLPNLRKIFLSFFKPNELLNADTTIGISQAATFR